MENMSAGSANFPTTVDDFVEWESDSTPIPELVSVDPRPGVPKRLHDRVVIVGFADGHRDQAPWNDLDTEFWGLNTLHSVLPNRPWTRWFELHGLEKFYGQNVPHQRWLAGFQGDIFIRPQDAGIATKWGIRTAKPYPIDRVIEAFGNYFTNSVSYMIALAVAMGFKRMELFGVDMAQDQLFQAEYRQQRPSCEFMLGVAAGQGMEIVLPPGSDLLKSSHLYGFEDSDPMWDKAMNRFQELGQRKEIIRGKMHELQQQVANAQSQINQIDGAMQEVRYRMTNLTTPRIGVSSNEQSTDD